MFPVPRDGDPHERRWRPVQLGDLLLTVGLWIEAETVTLDAADKVEYGSEEIQALQRVAFSSRRQQDKDWRISLQIPKQSENTEELRTGGAWPGEEK